MTKKVVSKALVFRLGCIVCLGLWGHRLGSGLIFDIKTHWAVTHSVHANYPSSHGESKRLHVERWGMTRDENEYLYHAEIMQDAYPQSTTLLVNSFADLGWYDAYISLKPTFLGYELVAIEYYTYQQPVVRLGKAVGEGMSLFDRYHENGSNAENRLVSIWRKYLLDVLMHGEVGKKWGYLFEKEHQTNVLIREGSRLLVADETLSHLYVEGSGGLNGKEFAWLWYVFDRPEVDGGTGEITGRIEAAIIFSGGILLPSEVRFYDDQGFLFFSSDT